MIMPTPSDIRQILKASPSVRKHRPAFKSRSGKGLSFITHIRLRDISDFTRQLATMIQARMPLARSLDILESHQKNRTFQQIIRHIGLLVKAGKSLSDGFQSHIDQFGTFYVNMVRVGEVSGNLPEMLQRIADYFEKMVQLRRKIITALTYPAVVIIVAAGAISFLVFGVMPTFQDMFQDFQTGMPLTARILIGTSQWIQSHAWYLTGAILTLIIMGRWLLHTEKGRWISDRIKFKLPLIGPLLKKVSIARFTRTLSTLLGSGVSLLEALSVTAGSSGNRLVESHVLRMRSMAARGEAMEKSLAASSFFPELVVQMIAVGEETAELPHMLSKTADYYENEVDAALEALTSIIEPIIIVVLGVIVGGVIITIYMQIFDLMNVIE